MVRATDWIHVWWSLRSSRNHNTPKQSGCASRKRTRLEHVYSHACSILHAKALVQDGHTVAPALRGRFVVQRVWKRERLWWSARNGGGLKKAARRETGIKKYIWKFTIYLYVVHMYIHTYIHTTCYMYVHNKTSFMNVYTLHTSTPHSVWKDHVCSITSNPLLPFYFYTRLRGMSVDSLYDQTLVSRRSNLVIWRHSF